MYSRSHLYSSATLEKRRHENTASGCPRFSQFTGLSLPPFLIPPLSSLCLRYDAGPARGERESRSKRSIIYVSTGRPCVCPRILSFKIPLKSAAALFCPRLLVVSHVVSRREKGTPAGRAGRWCSSSRSIIHSA